MSGHLKLKPMPKFTFLQSFKKLTFLFFFTFSFSQAQIDLASWALTNNGNPVNLQPEVNAGAFTSVGLRNVGFSTTGVSANHWTTNRNLSQNTDYYQISIKPTAGEALYINNLTLTHRRIDRASGSRNMGPRKYTIRYSTDNFFTFTDLVTNQPTDPNGISETLPLNIFVNDRQTLRVRFYGYDSGTLGKGSEWQIDANTLKVNGYARLCGDFIVGVANGLPFNSLTNAVEAVNKLGVKCAVNYLLDDSNYSTNESFPITINQFTGTSATNLLTIRPNAGKTVVIQANDINTFTGIPAVFKFLGADNISINGSNNVGGNSKDLIIRNNNSVSYVARSVVWIASSGTNASQNITVKNTLLKQGFRNGDFVPNIGIYSGNNTSPELNIEDASAANSNILLENNDFENIKQGVYINSGTNRSSNVQVIQNSIGSNLDTEKAVLGIYIKNTDSFTIDNNTIDGVLVSNFHTPNLYGAIYIDENSTQGIISMNKILNVIQTNGNGISGIRLSSKSSNANISVFNNFVLDVRAPGSGGVNENGFGIGIFSGSNYKIYHNTVKLVTSQNLGISAALFIDVSASNQLDIRNNILVNAQTSGAIRFAIYSNVTNPNNFTGLDFNNYVSNQHIGSWGSHFTTPLNIKSTLSSWQAVSTKDQNSVSINPVFISSNDLHLLNGSNDSLDNIGTLISSVSMDIDNQSRSLATPDMGADEFGPPPLCSNTTTWTNSGWNSGLPTINKKVILNENYDTATNGDFEACELKITSNKTLAIAPNSLVKVNYGIEVKPSAGLIITDSGSLAQIDDNAVNTGNITVERNTTPVTKFDFTYWSSPVSGQTLFNLSTNTLKDKYFSFDTAIQNWKTEMNGTSVMAPGVGYIIRSPQPYSSSVPSLFQATFSGTPNNGVINVNIPLNAATTGNLALIGNPYPSAVDADAFINANATVLNGALYFWTHNTPISTNIYHANDYAVYTLMGGVGTSGNPTPPTGKIASGQGFFVDLKDGLGASANLVFNNSMRVATANQNAQFFAANQSRATVELATADTATQAASKSRLWLNLTNDQGAFSQTLVGYADAATNGFDRLFDGLFLDGFENVISFYSLLQDQWLSIQAKAMPFDNKDIIPLGYKSTIAGTFTISIADLDGLFGDQDVVLEDKLMGTTQLLKESDYTFTTEKGTFNDRFVISFPNKTLSAVDFVSDESAVQIFSTGNQLTIKSVNESILVVAVYDITGRKLFYKSGIDLNEIILPIQKSNQLLIAKIGLEGGNKITKKIQF